MNDSLYEDYMRSVLGYEPMDYRNTYDMNYDNFMPVSNMEGFSDMQNMRNEELERSYPDIYRVVYPMVQKACMQNTRSVTSDLVDSMTNEIYFAIEDNELVGTRTNDESSSNDSKSTSTRSEDRQRIRNPRLNDLIRILIIRELLRRPGFPGFPGRPPHRPPMRPPMGRPPIGRPPVIHFGVKKLLIY